MIIIIADFFIYIILKLCVLIILKVTGINVMRNFPKHQQKNVLECGNIYPSYLHHHHPYRLGAPCASSSTSSQKTSLPTPRSTATAPPSSPSSSPSSRLIYRRAWTNRDRHGRKVTYKDTLDDTSCVLASL